MAVNLSDLAAMGAQPRWCTLALTLPKSDETWLEGFSRGLFELAERFGVSLVGGDLTRGPLTVTLQLMGRVERDRMLTRGGGNVGDDIYVTGTLGDSAAGIALITERVARRARLRGSAALKERFYRPQPRVASGARAAIRSRRRRSIFPTGCSPISATSARRAVAAPTIDVERVPLSAELLSLFPPQVALAHALGGGDDYELCFTAPPSRAEQIEAALEACGTPVRRIGQLVPGQTVVCRRDGEPYTPAARGYAHF